MQVYHEYAEEITELREGNLTYPYEQNGTEMDGMVVRIGNISELNYSGNGSMNESNASLNGSSFHFNPLGDEIHSIAVSILFKEDPNLEEDAFDTLWPEINSTRSNLRKTFECIADRFFLAY